MAASAHYLLITVFGEVTFSSWLFCIQLMTREDQDTIFWKMCFLKSSLWPSLSAHYSVTSVLSFSLPVPHQGTANTRTHGSGTGRCLHLPLECNSDWWVLIRVAKSIHPIVYFCFEHQATIKLKTTLYFWNLKFQTMHLWIIYGKCVFSNVRHKMEWMRIHTCPELCKVHANKQNDNLPSLLPCKIYSASTFLCGLIQVSLST